MTLVATFVPEVTMTTTLPVVAAEAVEAAATTELALTASKELCAVKLHRFKTSRTSLSFRSSASSSVSYCLTQASQAGRRVDALGAVQIQLFSPLSSLSGAYVSNDCRSWYVTHTEAVVTVAGDCDYLRAQLCALLGDVVLFNLLRCGERSQGSGNGEVLEEHCDSRW